MDRRTNRQRQLSLPCRKRRTPESTSDGETRRIAASKRSKSAFDDRRVERRRETEEKKENEGIFGDRILCRDAQMNAIERFVAAAVENESSAANRSLYISGPPGTGKTACVEAIVARFDEKVVLKVTVNCMRVETPRAAFIRIAEQLGGFSSKDDVIGWIEDKLATLTKPLLIVVDEVDQMESKNQDVLYTLFGWSSLPNSKVILICIANALDLTDRLLPHLQTRSHCKPELLQFSSYTTEQIVKILEGNIKSSYSGARIDSMAVQYCARKIAALTGDIRKAFDLCRRALGLGLRNPNVSLASGSSIRRITVAHVAAILSNVYDCQAAPVAFSNDHGLPLQQKIAASTLFALVRSRRSKEITIGRLHEAYVKGCTECHVTPVSQGEFVSVCDMLQVRGIVRLSRCKDVRLMKIRLAVDEEAVDHAIKDRTLLHGILASKAIIRT